MEFIDAFIDIILHLDVHLASLAHAQGPWVYGVLFLIVFCETGLVVTPFLPGDSLLFAAGTLAALGVLSALPLIAVLLVAAVAGDALNYRIGRWVGPRIFRTRIRFLNQSHLDRTTRFYEIHGGKTIVLARFVPIVRTYAPFVAGVGQMDFRRFAAHNVSGGLLWVVLFVSAGYFFGNMPVVKENLALVVLGIVGVSLLPLLGRWVSRAIATARVGLRRSG